MNSIRIRITKDCKILKTSGLHWQIKARDEFIKEGSWIDFPSDCVEVEGMPEQVPSDELKKAFCELRECIYKYHGKNLSEITIKYLEDVYIRYFHNVNETYLPPIDKLPQPPAPVPTLAGYCSACQHLDDEEYCVKCDDKHNEYKPKTAPTPDTAPIDAMAYCRELEAKLSSTNRRYNSLAIDRDNINKRLEKLESEKGYRLAELDKRLSALEKLISVLEKLTVADLLPILSHLFNNDMKRAREMFDTLLERYSK